MIWPPMRTVLLLWTTRMCWKLQISSGVRPPGHGRHAGLLSCGEMANLVLDVEQTRLDILPYQVKAEPTLLDVGSAGLTYSTTGTPIVSVQEIMQLKVGAAEFNGATNPPVVAHDLLSGLVALVLSLAAAWLIARQLLDLVYKNDLDVSERAVDSHMKNLRRKLSQAAPERELIRSVCGVGFAFEP